MEKPIKAQGYLIYFENKTFSNLKKFFIGKDFSDCFILVDENTEKHCLPILLKQVKALSKAKVSKVPSGENNKSLEVVSKIWAFLSQHRADRKALLINLGGGVIGDMGGFAASTYKRGIRFIQVPTTLLAMADASVGGKTGIDFMGFKNQVGLFKQPDGVFIFPPFIESLSDRQVKNGFSEVIKAAIIADQKFWSSLVNLHDTKLKWKDLIHNSVLIKNKIVNKDFKEEGERKKLNFAHTIGHAIESFFLEKKKKILHGEAIAIGMITETFISQRLKYISDKEANQIGGFILQLYGKVKLLEKDYPKMLDYMFNDKKNLKGDIRMALPVKIGFCKYDVKVSQELIIDALNYYNSL